MRTEFLLLAGCCALLSVGWKERDATKTKTPAIPPPHPAKTAMDVANRLDAMLQPRFLERAEDFGLDRVYIPLNAHEFSKRDEKGVSVRQPLYDLIGRDGGEKTLLAEANAPQKDYVVAFLHCASTLGKPGDKNIGSDALRNYKPPFYLEPLVVHEKGVTASYLDNRAKIFKWLAENLPNAEKSLSASAVKAKMGEKTSDTVGAYMVTLRPVKAQASCLGCHGRAKAGDTLGVMAYAVKK